MHKIRLTLAAMTLAGGLHGVALAQEPPPPPGGAGLLTWTPEQQRYGYRNMEKVTAVHAGHSDDGSARPYRSGWRAQAACGPDGVLPRRHCRRPRQDLRESRACQPDAIGTTVRAMDALCIPTVRFWYRWYPPAA